MNSPAGTSTIGVSTDGMVVNDLDFLSRSSCASLTVT